MTATYRQRIEQAVAPLLQRGFQIVEAIESPPDFGNTRVVLSSPTLSFRVTSDRGEIFLDVKRGVDDKWFSLRELLKLAGLTPEVGPWETAQEALDALERNLLVVAERLNDAIFRDQLIARR